MADLVNDIISQALSLTPIPGLHFAFTTLRWIINTSNQIQDSKEQIRTLKMALAQLLVIINEQYRQGKLIEHDTRMALATLEKFLEDVGKFIEAQAKTSVFLQILTSSKRLNTIDTFHRRLTISINSFQVAALVDTQNLLAMNERARQNDQQQLHHTLRELENNQRLLMETLDTDKNEPAAMMAALQRRIGERGSKGGQDNLTRFYTTTLRVLAATSGKTVDTTPWTITSFDVEFGPQIGSGGFGTVYRGKWNEMDVAIKVMRNGGREGIPREVTVRREVDTWSRLRHPHILQFLGANLLDNRPFIVTPYLSRGNAAEYVVQVPDCNRLEIVHHICLGLTYLHGQRVVHGDIKGTNVLIDDSGKGVLCDFGLARIRADAFSYSTEGRGDTQMGSQNWMAPELFQGASLRMASDIYALGMTIYELFTGEVPLSNIHPVRLQESINNNIRPQRPDRFDAPQMTDQIWAIATSCWAAAPESRPPAEDLCRNIKFILDAPSIQAQRMVSNAPASAPPQRHEFSRDPEPPLLASAPAPLPARTNLARNISLSQRSSTAPVSRASISSPFQSTARTISIVDSSLPTRRPYKRCLILKKPNSTIVCAALSANGKVYLTGHDDGTLRSWDAQKGALKRDYSLPNEASTVTAITFSPSTAIRYAAASTNKRTNTAVVYLVMKDKTLTCLQPAVSNISNLHITSDETIIGVECVGNDPLLVIWKRRRYSKPPSWDNVSKLSLLGLDSLSETLAGCGFVISPDGKTIWTGNTSRSLYTSSIETGQQLERPLHLGSNEVMSRPIIHETTYNTALSDAAGLTSSRAPPLVTLACSPDGRKVAVAYASGEILVLDLRSKTVKTMRDPAPVSASTTPRAPPIIFSGEGSRIVYPCNKQEKTIKIHDIATNTTILDSVYLADCPSNEIALISVTPSFKHVAVSFLDCTQALVYIWD